jgi:hypothetical protein
MRAGNRKRAAITSRGRTAMKGESRESMVERRALDLLDLICRDSLESTLGSQEPEHGQVSAWFVELRELLRKQGAVVEAAQELRRARTSNEPSPSAYTHANNRAEAALDAALAALTSEQKP